MKNYRIRFESFSRQIKDLYKISFYIASVGAASLFFVFSYGDEKKFLPVFVGMLIGVSVSWMNTAISIMEMKDEADEKKIDKRLSRYWNRKVTEEGIVYSPKRHRWLIFDSENIKMTARNGTRYVSGPYGILRRFRKFLST